MASWACTSAVCPRGRSQMPSSIRSAERSSRARRASPISSRSPCGRSPFARDASRSWGRPASTTLSGVDTRLDALVRDAMSRYHVPGVAVGILHDGTIDVDGWGVTSVEHPLPVDADTLFQIASVTKTITATVIMRLVERDALDLDAPVRRYLPEFRLRDEDAASRATLRHLVTHTGGWLGDSFTDFGRGDDALARYVTAMAELEQLTPLGEIWHYSNSG